MVVDFGEWNPDLPALLNGGLITAKNCISTGNGYGELKGPNTSSGIPTTALTARCQGAVSTKNNAQSSFNFAGDATKLYSLSGTTWNNVSKGGGYNTQSTDRWFFTQWTYIDSVTPANNGQQIIATNFTDPLQVYTMGVSAQFSDLISAAAPPAGNKPKARYIATIRDFVVIANTTDTLDGNQPTRVRWSPFGNPAGDAINGWVISPATQCDFQNLNNIGGPIRQIVGGEYGTIFQEQSIWRMTYAGSPVVFQFDQVDKKNGTQASSSVVPFGTAIAYLGLDGFYIFDGMNSQNIGENKVNRTFFKDLESSYYDRIVGISYPGLQIIVWTYPSVGSNGISDKMIMFNYASNAEKRWTQCDLIESQHIFNMLTTDKLIINYNEVALTQNVPINSNQFKGGLRQPAVFGANNKMYPLNGDALIASFETHDYQLTPERTTDISLIRPVVTGAPNITLQLGERSNLTEIESYTPYDLNTTGEFPVRSTSRYHSFRVELEGGFQQMQGLEIIQMRPGGYR